MPFLLLPEHYTVLKEVMKEMIDAEFRPPQISWSAKSLFCSKVSHTLCIFVARTDLQQNVAKKCLSNLLLCLSAPGALEKCLESIGCLFESDLRFTGIFLTVALKLRRSPSFLEKLFDEKLFVFFLTPKWRSDAESMERLAEMFVLFYQHRPNLPLPRRLIHFVAILYAQRMYRLANTVATFLTERQREELKPLAAKSYEILKASPESKVDLMNLIRLFPFLHRDRSKLLRTLNVLLSDYRSPNLELLVAVVNALMPESMLSASCDKEEGELEEEEGEKPPIPMPRGVYRKFPEFWKCISAHLPVLRAIASSCRFHSFLGSPLNFIFRFPIVDDFELKLSYFKYAQRHKLESKPEVKMEFSSDVGILQSSREKLNLENDWRVRFVPSVLGSDRNWWELTGSEIFKSDLFGISPNRRCVTINSNCGDMDGFGFAGFFVGLALLNGQKLPAHLSPSITKSLLGMSVNLRDLEIEDVTMARSIRRILESDVSDLGLYFAVGGEKDGKPFERELVPNGSQIPVTNENKAKWAAAAISFYLRGGIKAQLSAFREGFFGVVEQKEIQMFTSDELEMVLCGESVIDVEDLRKNVIISSPYSLQHPVIRVFFEMLKRWNQADLGKLIWFITGSSDVPVGGFEALKKKGFVIQIQRGLESLPVSHTCFGILDLPAYSSVDIMERVFRMALRECNE
jgi:hypothetical protein